MDKQTEGRTKNGAVPVTKSTPDAPDKGAQKAHEKSQQRAGPDGPDATEIGDTFKKAP
ncbi:MULTISPECIES: hypothetical protein [unclassified Brevundimonas]|uniref:hypothetical protein n=1 Tax=unclassified Brevundimonas TaxID=2622653 RepID=UPI0025BD9277|nr:MULTISPECIES: hypothetical protein [unclassified Brevundimonas]